MTKAPASLAGGDAVEAGEGLTLDEPELRKARIPDALHGQRLDKALVHFAPEFSRNHLQGLIEAGHVRVDGQVRASSSSKVAAGQAIDIELIPTAESQAFRAEALPLSGHRSAAIASRERGRAQSMRRAKRAGA